MNELELVMKLWSEWIGSFSLFANVSKFGKGATSTKPMHSQVVWDPLVTTVVDATKTHTGYYA